MWIASNWIEVLSFEYSDPWRLQDENIKTAKIYLLYGTANSADNKLLDIVIMT